MTPLRLDLTDRDARARYAAAFGWPGVGVDAGDSEARAAFLHGLWTRGVRDLAVLRAFEAVPRAVFVPHRYADLAGRDVALPLPCGQTQTEPSVVARMVEALGVAPGCRVLEVGSGSGYAAAIMARLGADVLGVERFRILAQGAAACLSRLNLASAAVVWGDGLAVPPDRGPFERIIVHAALPALPEALASLLTPEGTVVFARREADRATAVRARRDEGGAWRETPVTPCRLRPLYDEPSAVL